MLNDESRINITDLIGNDDNCYSIKRVYSDNGDLSLVQVLDNRGRIYKCLFYNEDGLLSNQSVYDSKTGKEVMNITYRCDGKTISSVREYNLDTQQLMSVTFYKGDGKSPSSIIEYNDDGSDAQFSLFCDDGEVITQCI